MDGSATSALTRAITTPKQAALPPVEVVFRLHASFVWRVLQRLQVPPAELDDALQEVFLVVSRRGHEYEERGSIKAWLFTIARQIAMHARRSEQRIHARKERAKREALQEAPPAHTPEEQTAQRQAAARARELLGRLDADQAMVFFLAEVEGLTVPEIAQSLNLNLNTVYGRLRLARKRFEAMVRDEPEEA